MMYVVLYKKVPIVIYHTKEEALAAIKKMPEFTNAIVWNMEDEQSVFIKIYKIFQQCEAEYPNNLVAEVRHNTEFYGGTDPVFEIYRVDVEEGQNE